MYHFFIVLHCRQQKDKILELELSNRTISDENVRLKSQNSGLRKSIGKSSIFSLYFTLKIRDN